MTLRRAILMLALISGGCVHRPPAGSAMVWQLRGAVAAMQPDLVTVRHKTGQLVQVTIDDGTIITRGRDRQSAAAVAIGMRVMVTVETSAQHVYRARQIELFSKRSSNPASK
jgi:hypothetical protein